MLVKVTSDDIKDGLRCKSLKCPIAIAVNRLLPPNFYCQANTHALYIHCQGEPFIYRWLTTQKVKDFIVCFDLKKMPATFEFEFPFVIGAGIRNDN